MRISRDKQIRNEMLALQVVSVAFLVVAFVFWMGFKQNEAAEHWVKLDGIIYKIKVDERYYKNNRTWILKVFVKYTFEGKNGVYIDGVKSSRELEVIEKAANEFHTGDKFPLYVNPNNPIECVRDPYYDASTNLLGIIISVVLSGISLVWYLAKRITYSQQN